MHPDMIRLAATMRVSFALGSLEPLKSVSRRMRSRSHIVPPNGDGSGACFPDAPKAARAPSEAQTDVAAGFT